MIFCCKTCLTLIKNPKSFLQGLNKLLRNEQFVDVTLVINRALRQDPNHSESTESANEGITFTLFNYDVPILVFILDSSVFILRYIVHNNLYNFQTQRMTKMTHVDTFLNVPI